MSMSNILRVGDRKVFPSPDGICYLLLEIKLHKQTIQVFGKIPDGSGLSLSEEEIFNSLDKLIENLRPYAGKIEQVRREGFVSNYMELITRTVVSSFKQDTLIHLADKY